MRWDCNWLKDIFGRKVKHSIVNRMIACLSLVFTCDPIISTNNKRRRSNLLLIGWLAYFVLTIGINDQSAAESAGVCAAESAYLAYACVSHKWKTGVILNCIVRSLYECVFAHKHYYVMLILRQIYYGTKCVQVFFDSKWGKFGKISVLIT